MWYNKNITLNKEIKALKRIIISMLSVLIIFSCVGCSNTNQPVEEVPEAKQEIVETDDVFIKELKNKQFKNSLDKLLPKKMIEPIIEITKII